MTRTFQRTVALDLDRGIDKEARTVSLAFSSEYPVPRNGYDEVLDHSPGNVDLSRLRDGHPLLRNHDPAEHVGTVERAWVDSDRKGRATVRFSRSTRGESAWQDVLDGVLRHVSVGYTTIKEVARKRLTAGRDLIRFSWQPHEVSLVPIPADPHCGIGRSAQTTLKTRTQIFMPDNENENEDQNEQRQPSNRAERRADDQRIRAINAAADAMARNHPERTDIFRTMASEAILRSTPCDIFNHELLTAITGSRKAQIYDAGVGMTDPEIGRYSLVRAVQSFIREGRFSGYEADVSRQYEKNSGQSAQGLWIPPDVLRGPSNGRRDMSVGTFGQGGAFVGTTVLTSPIEVLRNKMIVQRLGAQVFSGLQGNVAIPRQVAAATVYSLPETALLTVSNQSIDQILLSPHRIGAQGKYSKQLLLQSSVDVENFIRDDLMKQCAIKMDYLAIAGSGSNSEPVGIINTTGVGSITFGAAATYIKLVAFETSLCSVNADLGRLAYATTPRVRGVLKTLPKLGTTFPLFAWQKLEESDDGTNDGQVNDYRAASTNQIPGDAVIFGNWNDLVTAMWGGWDLVIDPFTAAGTAQVILTVNIFMDVAIRHAASFTVSSDSGAQ